MTSLPIELTLLLDRWESPNDPPQGRPALARELLACAQRTSAGIAGRDASHRWLDVTRRPRFLRALPDRSTRYLWADVAIEFVRTSHFTLETMLAQRVAAHPNHPFLRAPAAGPSGIWSYLQVQRRVRAIAACLLERQSRPPRVAIVADNGMTAACTDLACLTHDIVVAPLGVHLAPSELAAVLDDMQIDTVVTDSGERHQSLARLRFGSRSFRIVRTDLPAAPLADGDLSLPSTLADLDSDAVATTLAARRRLSLDETATVMFTPSSAGELKGVRFSQLNLVAKRFARAAALPDVGDDEVLLCYLPLFNTFGRFLELLGCLFWGGTYVFAGNPSLDTLLTQLGQVRPTGLISVPVRWAQLHSHCRKHAGPSGSADTLRSAVERTTGGSLRWGLSAAGRLEPSVFHFFHDMGVELCSGFGMTEATGGITMTPPGEYKDDSLGIPLPAIEVRLDPRGEMHIRGPYVGSPFRSATEPDGWFATGDVFRVDSDGHYTIVDKLKDIYKNARGQTVAPLRVEQKLQAVPGVRRVFVAGDGRDDNVALMALDFEHPAITSCKDAAERQDYVAQAVVQANQGLAPFERVVAFRIIDRDLSPGLGELTDDGSPRRKAIVQRFAGVIEEMYAQRSLRFVCGPVTVIVPRWLPRDLGVLLSDFACDAHGLINRRSGRALRIVSEIGIRTLVGDLDYELVDATLDLGRLVRQPRLWVGNRALTAFATCKDGWDADAHGLTGPLLPSAMPAPGEREHSTGSPAAHALDALHSHVASALLEPPPECLTAVAELAPMLGGDSRVRALVRKRLSLLCDSPYQEARALAFSTLLLDAATPDDADELLAFLRAGLPAFDHDALVRTISSPLLPARLDALRRACSELAEPARDALFSWLHALTVTAQGAPDSRRMMRGVLARWTDLATDQAAREHAAEQFAALAGGAFERTIRLQVASAAAPGIDSPLPDPDMAATVEARSCPAPTADAVVAAISAAPSPEQGQALGILWTRAMAAYLRVSQSLDFRFVATPVTPSCVSLGTGECADRVELVGIESMADLRDHTHLLELIRSGFYTASPSPAWRSPGWLFDALAEVVGVERSLTWSRLLPEWSADAEAWSDSIHAQGYVPVAVRCALAGHRVWLAANSGASVEDVLRHAAKAATEHRVDQLPLIARLHYARETRFALADEPQRAALARVIAALATGVRTPVHELVETAELFEVTASRAERIALRELMFGR